LDAAHIPTLNCDEMAGDKPRQPAHEIFSIKRRFLQFKSRLFKFKKAGAGERQKRLLSHPLKSGYLPLLAGVA